MYDVSTSPAALNAAQPVGNLAIYNDLASGNSYGAYMVPVSGVSTPLTFSLGGAALADIGKSAGGDFSVGGALALTSGAALPANSNEFLFAGSENQNQAAQVRPTLTLVTAPVPEASTTVSLGLLLVLGVGGLAVTRRRRVRA